MNKPILQTIIYKDGEKRSVVWCPFWGEKPKVEQAEEIKETDSHIEYIYYG